MCTVYVCLSTRVFRKTIFDIPLSYKIQPSVREVEPVNAMTTGFTHVAN